MKKQPTGGNRLVAYYRYSGGSHQTEQSIEGQRRDCETYARIHGMVILHEYIDRRCRERDVRLCDLLENRPHCPFPV